MKGNQQPEGFTLMEVIIAVGLFVTAVTVIIGLIAGLSHQEAESTDRLAAQRLPGPLKVELTRLAHTGLDQLASQIPVMAAPLGDGLRLVSRRDATSVELLSANIIPVAEQYYLIECWKFPNEPLRFDSQKAFLALHVRVSWPYRLPGAATPTLLADRGQITFTMSLTR